MRPEHSPQGDPCTTCGLSAVRHRKRTRARGDYFRAYNKEHGARPSQAEPPPRIIAIDGEGYTSRGKHLYTYLSACDEQGLVRDLHCSEGVTAEEVFAFLTSLPADRLLVGFALGYDRTKWLESWPDDLLWSLLRPEERQGKAGPLPIEWGGYRVNLVSSRFSIVEKGNPKSRRTVWDVFRFFQSSFVKALERWDVGTAAERESIAEEKARRRTFSSIGQRERAYCQLECRLCAVLVRRLIEAHEAENLHLRSYFGPGSSAAIVLREHGEQRAVYPRDMREAVMSAYFGGRFEDSRVGPIEAKELYAYDIRSAYPDAMARLPCFRHGKWRYVARGKGWEKGVTLARFHLPANGAPEAWGPLPHRMTDGNILYPRQGAGGWAWNEEVKAGLLLHPGIKVESYWRWEPECKCPPPFAARIHELYEARLRLGKAARGLVLKLVLNSLYGKSAQRVGRSRFRCMVRAGLITSLTRAKLLRAVATAKDPWNVLELATDSILSYEPLPIESEGLGGWERKEWTGGVFLLRPGLRFALERDERPKRTAARGVGVRVLHENRAKVLGQWEREPMSPVTLPTPSFFHGARLEVRRSLAPDTNEDERAFVYKRSPAYGTWTDEERTIRFTPAPKRQSVSPSYRLALWELPMGEAFRSAPYGDVDMSDIGEELEAMRALEEEQPDRQALEML